MIGSILFLLSFLLNRYAFSCTCDYASRFTLDLGGLGVVSDSESERSVLCAVCSVPLDWLGESSCVGGRFESHYYTAITVHTTLFVSRRIHHIVDQHSFLAIQTSSLVQSAKRAPTPACVEYHTTQPSPMTERVPFQDYLSLPHSSSSSALHRQTSSSSSRSGSGSGSGSTSINTKKNGATPTNNGSAPSSGSVSKATSFMSTPRLLSRRNSSRDTTRPGANTGTGAGSYLIRKLSGKGKGKAREVDLHLDEPLPLPGVIGTAHGAGHGTETDDVESNVYVPFLHS